MHSADKAFITRLAQDINAYLIGRLLGPVDRIQCTVDDYGATLSSSNEVHVVCKLTDPAHSVREH